MTPDSARTMARYNAWANRRVFAACSRLAEDAYRTDRGAFFGSIHRTLNHLLACDVMDLSRIEGRGHAITALDQELHAGRAELAQARAETDSLLTRAVDRVAAAGVSGTLRFAMMSGTKCETPMGLFLAQMFNHQTHHRGQVHCMLTQAGAEAPPLDLLVYLDEGARA